jgi:hypothetical protein
MEEVTLDSGQVRHDALVLTVMASGHLCLNLSESVSWEDFPAYANAVLAAVGGKRTRSAEASDVRLWEVVIDGQTLRLVFDDFPAMVSLESQDALGDAVLREIQARLARS